MRDRIRPPKELEFILDQLKDSFDIFETKQKGLMFAAAVGFALHRNELNSTSVSLYGEGIRLHYFSSPQDEGFIDAIAVASFGDLNILDPERQPDRIELFEKCAFLGLQSMKKHCFDNRPEDPILGILALVDEIQCSRKHDLPGLGSVAEKLGEYL